MSQESFPFDQEEKRVDQPLANRMRPHCLEEFVGQEHLLGPGKLIRRMLDTGRVFSIILWGPPGSGKNHPGQDDRPPGPGSFRRVLRRPFRSEGYP